VVEILDLVRVRFLRSQERIPGELRVGKKPEIQIADVAA